MREISIKKVLALLLAFVTLFSSTSCVYAEESVIIDEESQNGSEYYEGVSPVVSSYSTYSTSKPSSVWNIATKGAYDFSGWSYYQKMYTNYKFNGKTSYSIKVTNSSDYTLTVKAANSSNTYGKTTVGAGKTETLTISGMSKDTSFYISFNGNGYYMSFSGSIS